MRIGLTETLIHINEDVGVREVCAEVFEGELERDVEVILSINPDTATGKHSARINLLFSVSNFAIS